jgi:Protein of unknown function (DUF2924)
MAERFTGLPRVARVTARRRTALNDTLEADLNRVDVGRLGELREIWENRLGYPPPPLRSREIFRHMLAYRLQAAAFGDLSPSAKRKLTALEARRAKPGQKPRPAPIRLGPGALLVREWKGVRHEVAVLANGYQHQDVTYKSLSEVARAIAGSRWNGPLFFGLRDKPKATA